MALERTMLVTACLEGAVSGALACLDLSAISLPELASLVGDEATRLLGGQDAVVWAFRPGLGRFLYAPPGAEPKSVEATENETAELATVAVTSGAASHGVLRRLVETSFGVATRRRCSPCWPLR